MSRILSQLRVLPRMTCKLKPVVGSTPRTSVFPSLYHPRTSVFPSLYHPVILPSCTLHTSGNLAKNSDGSSDSADAVEPDDVWGVGDMYQDQYLQPLSAHRVLILQPDLKLPGTRTEDLLGEAVGLVSALPGWSVTAQEIVRMRRIEAGRVFTKGVFDNVQTMVRDTKNITAVFLNLSMITGLQLVGLQKAWRLPVYDRYTIILQIFRERAKTQEAKLQLAMAEIPYYRSRFRGMHEGGLDHQMAGLEYTGGSGETIKQTRRFILAEKEQAIRKKLEQLKSHREMLRSERKKKKVPTVAVVGYTNSGKTSLIQQLTQNADLQPWDQVFATLDVTCHAGLLGNGLKVLYVDTVGFISDIPTSLIASFSATLEDTAAADVILHVRDASRPDTEQQKDTVLRTLSDLKLPTHLLENIIEVNNKVDLIDRSLIDPSASSESTSSVSVSAVTGEGLAELVLELESAVISTTGRLEKQLKIPQSGPHLAWLYREATVTECRPNLHDNESLLVDVVMTTAAYHKFCATFKKKRRKVAE